MLPFPIGVPQAWGIRVVPQLARYVVITRECGSVTAAQIEKEIWNVRLPFRRLPVWNRMKFQRTDPVTSITSTADIIHSCSQQLDARGQIIPSRFDTAWIADSDEAVTSPVGIDGYSVGRVRVIFSIPERYHTTVFGPNITPAKIPPHLAYIQWFSPLRDHPNSNALLYEVSPLSASDGSHISSIIPLSRIRRSVHLFPKFGPIAPAAWTTSNVLDQCHNFYINDFTDKHFYRITSV